ncbi:MAG TPA: hypothetical protein VLW85_25515 [Myxococcales bacterium]|nr:hypothetical protein [Myxococcales bacterium]
MMFFTWDVQAAASGSFALTLDDGLALQPANPSLVPEDGVVRITPDGAYVVWMRRAMDVPEPGRRDPDVAVNASARGATSCARAGR